MEKNIKSALFGVAVGDALGVPVEFKNRAAIAMNPITDMTGYGTYNLPPGTWSDDSSLTFCLAESLSKGYNLQNIADNFARWLFHAHWTPCGVVFDVGIATRTALANVKKGYKPESCGGIDEGDNGNGSLMRILPLLFYIKDMDIEERYTIIEEVSSITHAHARSINACFYYLEFARRIVLGEQPMDIYETLKDEVLNFLLVKNYRLSEMDVFGRLLVADIYNEPEAAIRSSGYVVHTLEAAIWCLLTTNSFEAAVLKAVNLGEDTDTTGAVTGGLAALYYGFESIPQHWINQLARKDDIDALCSKLAVHFAV